jgi:hypothetical protein
MMNRIRLLRALLTTVFFSATILGSVACSGEASQTTALPYTDDFSNTQSGWQTSADLAGDVTYDGGRLRIVVKNENLNIWSTAGKSFTDGMYQIDAQPIGGPQDNGFGILFRVSDRKNFYYFVISSDGYWQAGLTKDNKMDHWSDWQQHPAIKTGGERNRIRVVMTGPKFDFYVNDQLIGSREDASFAQGDIGVMALTVIDQPGTDVVFDDASVTAAQ